MFRSIAAVSAFLACAFAAAAFAQTSAPSAPPPAPLMPITVAGDAEHGKIIGQTCTGCHGIPGYFNAHPAHHVPMLGGQNAVATTMARYAMNSGRR